MDNVVDKKLSQLSRGFGTASGKLIRDTPLFSTDSEDNDLKKENSVESLREKLFLLRIRRENAQNFLDRLRNYNYTQATSEHLEQPPLHKTYSTREGNLILYAENVYHGERKRKKSKQKRRKVEVNDFAYKGTCEDLAQSILRFGDGNFEFLKSGNRNLYDERVISVRPGYSPMRYVASASKLWDPSSVEKMLSEKALHESYLEKYNQIKLPKIDVIPSSNFDPLLRDRPKPYSRVSLPDIYFKSKEEGDKLRIKEEQEGNSDSSISSKNKEEKTVKSNLGHSIDDNASSGYAKSFVSDNVLQRKKRRRKKTMMLNKLEIEMPKREVLPKIEVSESEESGSEAEWDVRKVASRRVLERTFRDLLEQSDPDRNQENIDSQNRDANNNDNSSSNGSGSSYQSPTPSINRKSLDYSSLPAEKKADLISQLLLQGLAKEASDVDSVISKESRSGQSMKKRQSIDISDSVSLPPIQTNSVSDSQSLKGFRGNALHSHSGALSAHSSKSKSSKEGSIKTSSSGLVVSSIRKLPPIKSEPSTPNVNKSDAGQGDAVTMKHPQLSKRTLGHNGWKSQRINVESDDDLSGLFVGGRGIDVSDVEVAVVDDDVQKSIAGGQDVIEGTVREDSTVESNKDERDIVAQENLTGHQSPDSGRSSATGLTSYGDAQITQHENQVNKEPMTPVVEESSRESMASKNISREGTFNRNSGGLKHNSFISEQSSLKGASLAEQVEDSLLLIKGIGPENGAGVSISKEEEAYSDILKADAETENGDAESEHDQVNSVKDEDLMPDEGVAVDGETMKAGEETTKEDELPRGRTYTDTKTIAESIDIVLDEVDNTFDRNKSEGSFSSLLQAQAHAAAHSALARPKSGRDLIEDMKVASAALGDLFAGNIRREASRSSKLHHRAESDLTGNSKHPRSAKRDEKRSATELSMKSAKRMHTVDIDKIKANVSSMESLIDKKINQSNKDGVQDRDSMKDNINHLEENLCSEKSVPAASEKSGGISADEIQMDIIGYVNPEKSQPTEQITVITDKDATELNIDAAVEKEPSTDEEQFKLALNALVDEVKDLKEKKAPKPKKVKKVRIAEDRFNIIRDRTSASPPFYAGKPKENKAPKGLSRVVEQSKKEGVVKSGKAAGKPVGKKAKKKVGKKEKKSADLSGKNKDEDNHENSKDANENDGSVSKGVKSNKDDKSDDNYDKYDVPILIKTAAEKPVASEAEKSGNILEKPEQFVKKREFEIPGKDFDGSLRGDTMTLTETDTEGSVNMSANGDGVDERVAAARARGRQLAAEKRRLKVEERRRQKEEAKRKAIEDAEKAERLRIEGELEMQRRMEEYKKQKENEEEERLKKERQEKERLRRLEMEKERERREKEEIKRKRVAIAARLKLEEDMRRERERIAKQIEEDLKREEEEKLKQMEEQERLEYQRQKELEEQERIRQEEERQRIERERRLIEEEELRIKMQKLEEFHRMLLERAKFWEGMKNSKWFLEWNQRLTRAFTFSYYDLLPAMLFPFSDLRPFTPKDGSKKLPTIPEEK